MSSPKKKGMLRRFFSKKGDDSDEEITKKTKDIKLHRSQTVDPRGSSQSTRVIDDDIMNAPVGLKKKMPGRQSNVEEEGNGGAQKKQSDKARKISTAAKKKQIKRKESSGIKVDVTVPVSYPCTPELILEYHKKKPFLSSNEEWLLVELNEFECLVDSEEIIKVIAKHSKFFEVDPDELWAEFFEYVEEMPAYDEVINYDIWQEFRDEKYPC